MSSRCRDLEEQHCQLLTATVGHALALLHKQREGDPMHTNCSPPSVAWLLVPTQGGSRSCAGAPPWLVSPSEAAPLHQPASALLHLLAGC